MDRPVRRFAERRDRRRARHPLPRRASAAGSTALYPVGQHLHPAGRSVLRQHRRRLQRHPRLRELPGHASCGAFSPASAARLFAHDRELHRRAAPTAERSATAAGDPIDCGDELHGARDLRRHGRRQSLWQLQLRSRDLLVRGRPVLWPDRRRLRPRSRLWRLPERRRSAIPEAPLHRAGLHAQLTAAAPPASRTVARSVTAAAARRTADRAAPTGRFAAPTWAAICGKPNCTKVSCTFTGGQYCGASATAATARRIAARARRAAPATPPSTSASPRAARPTTTCTASGVTYCGTIGDGCGGSVDCGSTCPTGHGLRSQRRRRLRQTELHEALLHLLRRAVLRRRSATAATARRTAAPARPAAACDATKHVCVRGGCTPNTHLLAYRRPPTAALIGDGCGGMVDCGNAARPARPAAAPASPTPAARRAASAATCTPPGRPVLRHRRQRLRRLAQLRGGLPAPARPAAAPASPTSAAAAPARRSRRRPATTPAVTTAARSATAAAARINCPACSAPADLRRRRDLVPVRRPGLHAGDAARPRTASSTAARSATAAAARSTAAPPARAARPAARCSPTSAAPPRRARTSASQQTTCPNGGTTSISGTCLAPTPARFGTPDPLYNALVYIPNGRRSTAFAPRRRRAIAAARRQRLAAGERAHRRRRQVHAHQRPGRHQHPARHPARPLAAADHRSRRTACIDNRADGRSDAPAAQQERGRHPAHGVRHRRRRRARVRAAQDRHRRRRVHRPDRHRAHPLLRRATAPDAGQQHAVERDARRRRARPPPTLANYDIVLLPC